MEDYWKPLNELVITPDINIIHVDTRDFHYVTNIMLVRLEPKALIKEDEIIPVLTDLYNKSGGNREWRMLSFDGYRDWGGSWCKYLRFYRVDKDTWSLCGQYKNPINNWREMFKHIKYEKLQII